MQRLMTYGLLTVVCGAFAPGCGGDTSGDRPTTMQPTGNAGGGGSGGQTGGANGGSAGTPVTGMGGATSGLPTFQPACSGCVELVVNISADPSKSAQFVIRPAAPIDMSTAVLTWRIRALTPGDVIPADQMFVTPFATNGMANNYAGAFAAQTTLTPANGFTSADTWADVTFDFNRVVLTAPVGGDPPAGGADAGADGGGGAVTPPAGGAFIVSMMDKTIVSQIGLQVGATPAFTGSGYVRIAIDSLSVSGVDMAVFAPREFSEAGGLVLNDYMVPAGTPAMPTVRP